MSETSSKEYNAGWGQTLASFIQIGIGIAMLVIGEKNLDPLDCANGASEYLFYGGIVIISANVVGILAGCARQAALKDGRISGGENCGLCVLGLLSGVLGIAALVTLIWGSVVVFGSWADWTSTDLTNQHFCKETPMMFAFVLLLINWVMFPLMICCCCCACCVMGCCAAAASGGQVEHVVQE
eukprot:TRINITY_DN20570_c0_g1_i1.p1 TRINITY_DN20570_c0_g1~~TRINITY_DN20570_c0_g1_i1.p1  ORF type:complete len:200 (-),score=35.44 TRINITY_DN20570_c0_g1_i1:141-689(-)